MVMQDPSRDVQLYVGQWRMFLPSDLLLDSDLVLGVCNLYFAIVSLTVRFSSIYHYDWNLFKARFIGPDGVPCAKCYMWCIFDFVMFSWQNLSWA